MPDPGDITEDRGFKALFTSYPRETIEVFVPELIAAHGQPVSVEPIQQELPLPDLGDPSRFLDLALLATWKDGSQSAILLVEHWSETRRVDLDRVLWYYAALRLRHPQAQVFPVVLVTDPGAAEVPDLLESSVEGMPVLSFRVRVVRIGPADLPRLRGLQNRVAAMLLTLAVQDAVEAVVAAMAAMKRAPGPVDDLRRFLPLAMKLARMQEADEPRFRHRLREEPDMGNMLDEIKVEGRAEGLAEGEAKGVAKGMAKGMAKGRAEGAIQAIRDLVTSGVLPVSAACGEIEKLIAQGVIPEQMGHEAIKRLG